MAQRSQSTLPPNEGRHGVGWDPGPHHVSQAGRYDYDVVVIGGRVAGAATGMLLARRGHKVLIVDRAAMPSDTVSTHAILRSGVLQLTRWGLIDRIVAAGTPPIRNITLGFGDDRIPFRVRPDFGIDTLYAPRRHLLDDILATAAREAGAEFLDRTTMSALLTERGVVRGVRIRHGRQTSEVSARWVVGADGHHSRVAEGVGAAWRRRHAATNTVHYGYFDGIDADRFWFQFTPGINAGLIPTNDRQCLVFTGRPAHLRSRFSADPDREFTRLLRHAGEDLAEVVSRGTRAGRFRGTSGLSGFIRQAWGPGWALVGDAGYTKDPISAHGISDALRDAELCARALDGSLANPGGSAVYLSTYESLRDSLSARMYEESRQLARFQWTSEEASARMRIVSDEVRRECEALIALPDWADEQPLVVAS